MAARSAGVIRINLTAGTTEFLAAMDRSNAKLREFGRTAQESGAHAVSGVQATSGALRVLEGGLNNNLRAAERFTANVLGLGPILQAAFPVIGALAFAGLLVKMGEEAYKFYTTLRDGPEKSAGAFRDLSGSLRTANDEMAVTNDRLEIQIAKLEGRRENTLMLALDETRLAADRLQKSLDNDLKSLHKLIEENSGGLSGLLREGDFRKDPLAQQLGGFTGAGGFNEEKAKIIERGNQALDKVATITNKNAAAKARDAAATKTETELLDAYDKQLKIVNEEIRKRFEAREGGKLPLDVEDYQITGKEGPEVERAIAIYEQLKEERRSVVEDYRNQSDQARLAKDTAANQAAKQDRPFDQKVAELKAQVSAANEKLKSAGLDAAAQAIAKAQADAIEAIQQVNNGLDRQHEKLIDMKNPFADVRGAEILSLAIERETANMEDQRYTKLAEIRDRISDQVQTQQMLNDAIGKGYEALRKVNVETALMHDFGAVAYNDLKKLGSVVPSGLGFAVPNPLEIARIQQTTAEEQKHAEEIRKTTLQLQDQIGLETRLAQVQAQGAAAVRLATLQYNIGLIQRDKTTKELTDDERRLITAEIERFGTENANQAAAATAKLEEQIGAVNRLTEAYLQGADAVRKAELENKLAQLGREGNLVQPSGLGFSVPTAQATAAVGADTAEHNEQIAKLAGETRLQNLNAEIAKLREALSVTNDQLGVQMEIKAAEKEHIELVSQEILARGQALDGLRAFFVEMQEQAKTTSQIIYESLNSALDKSTENLAKMLTEKKPKGGWGQAWGKEFQGIGTQMVQSTLKSTAQTALGKLGISLGTPDGSKANPIWVKNVDGLFTGAGVYGPTTGGVAAGIPGVTDSIPYKAPKTGFLGALGKLLNLGAGPANAPTSGIDATTPPFINPGDFTGLASGGYMSPDQAYVVGENGPEILSGISGRITSNAESRRMLDSGGANVVNNIDARGADLGAENRIRRSLELTHRAAVAHAVQATAERSRRVPGHSR